MSDELTQEIERIDASIAKQRAMPRDAEFIAKQGMERRFVERADRNFLGVALRDAVESHYRAAGWTVGRQHTFENGTRWRGMVLTRAILSA